MTKLPSALSSLFRLFGLSRQSDASVGADYRRLPFGRWFIESLLTAVAAGVVGAGLVWALGWQSPFGSVLSAGVMTGYVAFGTCVGGRLRGRRVVNRV
jgi:hypothetical protein